MATNKKLFLSASALKKFESCNRAWGYEYLSQIKPPSSKSLEFGIALHACAENYLKTGRVEAEDELIKDLVSRAIPELPLPKMPGLFVENVAVESSEDGKLFYADIATNISFCGKIDAFWQEGNQGFVLDHKTSSSISKYALTEETLLEDVQALIYAFYMFKRAPDLQSVTCKWVYYQTKGAKKIIAVENSVSRETMEAKLGELHKRALNVLQAKQVKSVKDLACNTSNCDAFGGCFYKNLCDGYQNRSAGSAFLNQIESKEGEKTMSDLNTFLSRLVPTSSTSSIEEKKVPDTHRIDPISGVEIPVFAYEKWFGYDGDGTEDFAVEKDKYGRIIEIEGVPLTQGQIETQTFFDLDTGFEDTPFRPLNSEKVANFLKYMGSSEEEKKEAADIAQAREDATNPFLSRFHKDVAYNPPESVIDEPKKEEESVAPKEKKSRKKREEVSEVLSIPLSAAETAAQPEEKTEERALGRLVVYMRCMPVAAPEGGEIVQIGELIHAFYLQIGAHYNAVKFGEGKSLLYNAIEKALDALLVHYNEVHLVVPICEELSILQSLLDARAHAKIVAF